MKVLKEGYKLSLQGDYNVQIADVITEATHFYAACYGSRPTWKIKDVLILFCLMVKRVILMYCDGHTK